MPDTDQPIMAAGRARWAPSIAWIAWLAAICLTAAGLVLILLTREVPWPESAWGFRGFPALFAVSSATVGAIVLARRPGNVVGWIFTAGGLLGGIQVLGTEYVTYGTLAHPGALVGVEWVAWVVSWSWVPLEIGVGLLFLVFPDGKLLSRRWRWAAWLAATCGASLIAGVALTPGPLQNFVAVQNPLGAGGAALGGLQLPLATVGNLGAFAALLLGALALVMRYRRGARVERQQLKWVAFAAAVIGLCAPLPVLTGRPGQLVFIAAVSALPIAAGIAVLRYRLYDIDLIINRTIVYGLLTAILAGIYAGTVALLQRLFVALTLGGSDAAIVLSTVVVVSVFTPIRGRLQRVVDRRFREVRDPRAPLAEFVTTIENGLWRLEPEAALRRLLDVAASALGAPAASVALGDALVARIGEGSFEPALVATAGEGPGRVTVAVGPRSEGSAFAERDRRAVQSAVAAVADALAQQA
jgi:hypothetical protein